MRQKFALVLVLLLASALLPLAWDTLTVAVICNGAFYAASLLIVYYLLVGSLRWTVRRIANVGNRWIGRAAAATIVAAAIALSCNAPIKADEPAPPAPRP